MSTTKNDLSFSTLALWAGLALVLILVGAVWIQAYYHFLEQGQITEKIIEVSMPDRELHAANQRELLEGYRWIDREKGVVGLPIGRAMELVLEDARGGGQ